jgi:seryl-tRNA synthetase
MTEVAWDMRTAYMMVRQRDHALTDRQRKLQGERDILSSKLEKLRSKIDSLASSIGVVERVGGDATSLRAQINAAHAEVRIIAPRHAYLEDVTSILAANLRLLHQAHDALHWLNYENGKLVDFDNKATLETVS